MNLNLLLLISTGAVCQVYNEGIKRQVSALDR